MSNIITRKPKDIPNILRRRSKRSTSHYNNHLNRDNLAHENSKRFSLHSNQGLNQFDSNGRCYFQIFTYILL